MIPTKREIFLAICKMTKTTTVHPGLLQEKLYDLYDVVHDHLYTAVLSSNLSLLSRSKNNIV